MVRSTKRSLHRIHAQAQSKYRIAPALTLTSIVAGFYVGILWSDSYQLPRRFLLGAFDQESAERNPTIQIYKPGARICNENPYLSSLLPGHSFELAHHRAEAWMANKTNIRDAMYFKSYGKHTHDKFDAFEVMAPCNYTCTGECRADTSKIVCGAETLPQGCVIYSIGGNNNWDFEERIYDMTPCEIHTFDCTGPIDRFQPPPRIQDRHSFHHVCLATQDIPPAKNPEQVAQVDSDFGVIGATETLQTIQKRLKHTRLDLLKLDIEGYEWPIFESWPELENLEAATNVALPMQILVEVHYRTQMHELWPQKGVIFKDEVDIVELQAHLLRIGYVVAHRDDNQECLHCTELTLLRHKCVAY